MLVDRPQGDEPVEYLPALAQLENKVHCRCILVGRHQRRHRRVRAQQHQNLYLAPYILHVCPLAQLALLYDLARKVLACGPVAAPLHDAKGALSEDVQQLVVPEHILSPKPENVVQVLLQQEVLRRGRLVTRRRLEERTGEVRLGVRRFPVVQVVHVVICQEQVFERPAAAQPVEDLVGQGGPGGHGRDGIELGDREDTHHRHAADLESVSALMYERMNV